MVIAMLNLCSSTVLFILTEWKLALMPVMPLRLYEDPAIFAMLIQNFIFDIVHYSHLYYPAHLLPKHPPIQHALLRRPNNPLRR